MEERAQILAVALRLYGKDCLAAGDGNISMRLSDGRILITPSGKAKAFMKPEEMALVSIDGTVLDGQPSSETAMHLAVYRRCPDAQAVVHAHPPHAIAWSLARPADAELPVTRLPELLLALGRCPIVPYALPGTEAMGEVLAPFLPERRAMVLRRHGALCWGESLEEACGGIERIEHAAKILTLAESLGGCPEIAANELTQLEAIRANIHPRIL